MIRACLFVLLSLSTQAFQMGQHNAGFIQRCRSGLNMVFEFKPFKKGIEDKMTKSLESIQSQMNTLRAGQANPGILDRVVVDYFGAPTPLSQLARVGTSGGQQLVVEPFDKTLVSAIDKAIQMAGLNLNPTNDGSGIIRIVIPPLTEERRKDLVKQAKTLAEDGKVAIRNIRRDAVEKIKKSEKSVEISKDSSQEYQDDLQKSTDSFIKKIDAMAKTKEKDLLTI
eukprot:gene5360-10711_t